MGRGSHEPQQPAVVLAQRYGDCKDKALLLAALLRELGVEAYPALVNTKLRQRLDDYLPSPFLFDHVITRSRRRQDLLDRRHALRSGRHAGDDRHAERRARAASCARRPTALTPIVIHSHGSIAVEEVITPATNGQHDDRSSASPRPTPAATPTTCAPSSPANRSPTSRRDHLNRYAADHPRIEALGAPSIDDDRLRNVIVLRERYTIRDLWKNGSWTYYPRAIEKHSTVPRRSSARCRWRSTIRSTSPSG